jgi:hypothetical protein
MFPFYPLSFVFLDSLLFSNCNLYITWMLYFTETVPYFSVYIQNSCKVDCKLRRDLAIPSKGDDMVRLGASQQNI